jgi:transposase-like protein
MPHYASSPVSSAWSRRSASYKRDRLPAEITGHCVWLYFRCCLSYRDVEGLMDDAART